MKKSLQYVLGALLVALLAPALASAQTTSSAQPQGQPGQGAGKGGMHRQMPGVFGTVSAVSGTSITVSSKAWSGPNTQSSSSATPTTYTVDASNASVMKDGATSSVSAIAVGDTLMVQGTISGTSVTATKINDGMPKGMPGAGSKMGTPPAMPAGNGEPIIGGSVSAVSGNTLTVAAKAGPSYSVDASAATVFKQGATSTLASVAVGDSVVVQGSVSGSSVTATSVVDSGVARTPGNASSTAMRGPAGMMGGFFGAIGGFFKGLFGFF